MCIVNLITGILTYINPNIVSTLLLGLSFICYSLFYKAYAFYQAVDGIVYLIEAVKLSSLKPNDVGEIIVIDGGVPQTDDQRSCLTLSDKWNQRNERELGIRGKWK